MWDLGLLFARASRVHALLLSLGSHRHLREQKKFIKQKQNFEPKKKTFGGLWQSLAANSQTSMC